MNREARESSMYLGAQPGLCSEGFRNLTQTFAELHSGQKSVFALPKGYGVRLQEIFKINLLRLVRNVFSSIQNWLHYPLQPSSGGFS